MARVMNLAKLKILLFSKLPQLRNLYSFIHCCQLRISLAQLISCEGLDYGLGNASCLRDFELGTLCLVGAGAGGVAQPSWRVC